jgi:ribosomal protein S18
VKHTDVLVIDQFLTSTGEIYSQEDLGICKRQWVRLRKLAEMAQRAGLMPGIAC